MNQSQRMIADLGEARGFPDKNKVVKTLKANGVTNNLSLYDQKTGMLTFDGNVEMTDKLHKAFSPLGFDLLPQAVKPVQDFTKMKLVPVGTKSTR